MQHGEKKVVGTVVVQRDREFVWAAAGVQGALPVGINFDASLTQVGESCRPQFDHTWAKVCDP